MEEKFYTRLDLEKAFNDGKKYGDGELPLINDFNFSSLNITAFDVWVDDFDDSKDQDIEEPRGEAVQVVIINEDGLVCLVSRKDNHSDFGLIGGKVDPGEGPEEAAVRECMEETGIEITNLRLIFSMHRKGRMGYTYLADYKGEINYDKELEPHVVKWAPMMDATTGSFAYWNKMVYSSMVSSKINFKK